MSEFIKIFNDNHQRDWNWSMLSGNPNALLVVAAHPDKPWDWKLLSKRASIQLVVALPDKPWNWQMLSRRLPLDDIMTTNLPWCWKQVCANPTLRQHHIDTRMPVPQLCLNRNLCDTWLAQWTCTNIAAASSKINMSRQFLVLHQHDWNYTSLSCNPHACREWVQALPDKPWKWDLLSRSADISLQWLLEESRWHHSELCINPHIQPSWLPHIVADWVELSSNLAITTIADAAQPWLWHEMRNFVDWTFVERHPLLDWNWSDWSNRAPLAFVLQHPGNWDWNALSMSPYVSWHDINTNRQLPWTSWVSLNPNTPTPLHDECNPAIRSCDVQAWDWDHLSDNEFAYDEGLQTLHALKMQRLRRRNAFAIPHWYRLHLLTKTQAFMQWYCGEGGVGRAVDHARIRHGMLCITNALKIEC